ncbi:g10826 [Coccomyxa elongata]
MLSTNSLFAAAQVVALGTIFPLFPAHPFSVWNSAFNPRSLSPDLQAWRALGKYYVFTDAKHLRQMSVFYVDFKSEPGSRADSKESKSTDSLLLLHGFPSCSADFQGKFLEKLLARFSRVISFDYPGYGFSDKPRGLDPSPYTIHTYADVAERLLMHLGLASVHVLAHDVGDTVAQELLARHNARQSNAGLTGGKSEGLELLSVAFLNGGLLPELHRPLLQQRLLVNTYIGPLLGPLVHYKRFANSMTAVFGPATPPSEQFLRNTYAALTFNGGNLILHELIKYIAQRVEHRDRWVGALQNTEVPLVLINGPADPISGLHAAEGYREVVPNPRVHLLAAHIGHYPQVEAPHQVLDTYFEFLQKI